MNTRGLQRLEEPGRQPQGHTVPVPGQPPSPRGKPKLNRLPQCPPLEIRHQPLMGLIIFEKPTAVDVPVADPMLQRDPPLPTDGERSRVSMGGQRPRSFTGNRDSPVTRQPVRPVLISGLQCSFNQKAPKTRAVDEQIRAEPLSAVHDNKLNRAIGTQNDLCDSALGSLYSTRLGIAAQVTRKQRSIQMQSIR